MRRFIKWAGFTLGGVTSLMLVALMLIFITAEIKLGRKYPLPQASTVTASPERAKEGAHLAQIYGCTGCHKADLTGALFNEIPDGTRLWSSNLPMLAKSYSDADFDRAIRHGLRADRTSVILMPSNAYTALSDDELAAIISFIRSLPPKGEQHPRRHLGLFVHAGVAFGVFKTAREELAGAAAAIDPGTSYAQGRHLALVGCSECHGSNLAGGAAVGPMPARPDLDLVASYDREDFVKFMRTGKAPGNRELPMMSDIARTRFSHFTDAEANALYDYLAARGKILAKAGR